MIRTLCTLTPGTKQDGTKCLKGELPRDVTTTDEAGHERRYPMGTKLVLSRKGDDYHLLALLPNEPLPPPLDQAAVRRANEHDAANMGPDYIPF